MDRTKRRARPWWALGATTAVLFVLAAVLVPTSAAVARFDEAVTAGITGLRRDALTPVVVFVTDLGSYLPVTLTMVLLALFLAYRTRRLVEPLVLVGAVEASESLVVLVKLAVDRTRPPVAAVLGAPATDTAFPSGHTASGTVLWVLGALLLASTQPGGAGRRALLTVGVALALLIGLSRVYLGFHWPTDVVGGWLLATALIGTGMGFVAVSPHKGDHWGEREINSAAHKGNPVFERLRISGQVAMKRYASGAMHERYSAVFADR